MTRTGVPDSTSRSTRPSVLELTQALGEQPVREPRHGPRQVTEAQRPLGEGGDDRAGPALADQLDRRVKVRTDAVAGLILGR